MTWYDYLINAVLVALVLLQIRGRRLTVRILLLPAVIVTVAAIAFLHGVPTTGNDVLLVASGLVAGLLLGVGCALTTAVWRRADNAVIAKAGAAAAVLWVAGTGARLAFYLYANHGGGAAIGRFSVAHQISPISEAWTACLLLMALAEAVSRSGVLAIKYIALRPDADAQTPTEAGTSSFSS